MPLINGLKQVGAGVGTTQVSIDNVPVGTGGCACWLDDDRLIFNGVDVDGQWKLLAYNQRTKATQVIDARGANFIAAQLGRYAAQAGSVYANFPFAPGSVMSLRITDGRGAFGLDGSIALCTDANCQAFDVYAPDGTTWHEPAVAYNLQILSDQRAIWDGGTAGYEVKCPIGMSRRRVVEMPDGDYIVGYAGGIGLVCVKNTATTDGRIITRDPAPAYHHDARAFGAQLLVCWSSSPSEAPGSNVLIDAMTLPIEPIVPAVVYPVYDFNHPVLVAPFKAEGSGVADIFTYGTYAEDAIPPGLPSTTRLLLAHDGSDEWTVPAASLRACDMVLREAYLLPSETLQQSAVRWQRQFRQVLQEWPGDVGVIPMFYDQQRWTVQQILDGLDFLQDVVNISPRIKMIAPFAYDRANGIVKYPELQRSFNDLCAAWHLAGDATLAPFPKPPDPPKPDPPKPTEPFPLLEVVHMDSQNVAVIGPNGLYGSVDQAKDFLGFSKLAVGSDETWSLALADGDPRKRYIITPPWATDHVLGVDTTQYGSNDIRKLFYLKPKSAGIGNYEMHEVRKDPLTGLYIAYVAYIDQGVQTKPFVAPGLTLVAL